MRLEIIRKYFTLCLLLAGLFILLKFDIALSQTLSNTLTWLPNSETNLTMYRIYRSTASGNYAKGFPLGNVPSGTINYSDSSIQPNITYYYVVTAVNSFGLESGYSNEVSISKTSQNELPILSNGQVTPSSGNTKTDFIFSVHYSDTDGQAPTVAKVYIDNVENNLNLIGGTTKEGDYAFTTKLANGSHAYYFFFTDNSLNQVRFPATGTVSEPLVTGKPDKPTNIRYKNK